MNDHFLNRHRSVFQRAVKVEATHGLQNNGYSYTMSGKEIEETLRKKEQKQELFGEVTRLYRQGVPKKRIARNLGINRQTVIRIAKKIT